MDIMVFLKIISFIFGGICLFFVWLSFESEEEKAQNGLMEFWSKVDEIKNISEMLLVKYIKRVSLFITVSINKIFGEKILSVKSIWISFFYLNGFISLIACFSPFVYGLPFGIVSTLITGILLLSLATLPLVSKTKKWIKCGCLVFFMFWLLTFILLLYIPETWIQVYGVVVQPHNLLLYYFATYLISAFLFMFIVSFYRWSIIKCSDFNSIKKIIYIVLLQLIFASTLIILPELIDKINIHTSPEYMNVMTLSDFIRRLPFAISTISSISLFPFLLFIILLFFIPVNKFIWSLVSRTIYNFARNISANNRGLIWSLAIILIGWPMKNNLFPNDSIFNGINNTSLKGINGINLYDESEYPRCSSIIIEGSVITNGIKTFTWFEWGTTPELKNKTMKWIFVEDSKFECRMINLIENTKYYYTAIGENEFGYSKGEIKTFITPKCEE